MFGQVRRKPHDVLDFEGELSRNETLVNFSREFSYSQLSLHRAFNSFVSEFPSSIFAKLGGNFVTNFTDELDKFSECYC